MSAQYSHTMTVDIGGNGVEIEFDYDMDPFLPEQGPTYASGGWPAEGGGIEIVEARVQLPASPLKGAKSTSEKLPDWMVTLFQDDDYILDELREAVE